MALWSSEDAGIRHAPLAAMARKRRAPSGDCKGVAVPCPYVIRWLKPGTTPPREEKAMPPEHIPMAGGGPRERSEDQGILLKHMSQLNQRLLGPWENADGQRLPRLTMAEAVAQLYEWSTEYRDHPELARRFAVMAAPSGPALPSA